MAITPAQAKAGVISQLSKEEQQKLADVEQQIDSNLMKIYKERPNSDSVGMAIMNYPPGSLSPQITANLVTMYKAAGWPEVIVHEHSNGSDNGYSINFQL